MRVVRFILLLLPLNTASQKKIWLHYDAGFSWDQRESRNGEPDFIIWPGINALAGGFIEHELDSCFSIEAGIASRFHSIGGSFTGSDTSNIMGAADYYQVPLRIRARWNILHNKVSLSPQLGFSLLFISGVGFNWIIPGQSNTGLDLLVLD